MTILCKLIKVSRSRFYDYLNSLKRSDDLRELALKTRVAAIFKEHRGHYRKLPSGLYQCVTFPKIALPDDNKDSKDIFLVIAQTGLLAQDLFFKHLDNSTDIPLHPLWSHWLWKVFSKKCWLTRLKTLVGDYQGYLIQINEAELSDTITMAIVEKNPAVIRCFEKGETDATDTQFKGVS